MKKKMREIMFTFQMMLTFQMTFKMMFTLMETVKKEKHLRYLLHILKWEGRNPQSKFEGIQEYLIKLKNYAM
ncbi:hypothetical protein Gogos_011565 [Gossypium gossypioides]|uniref:Uncharacterized protein n=1 Tax=Gossypium gossypioides TaxID=34282 RepID=A0A7J9BPS8_GOSGO|nr:hypothetical protein [Gossypium gossypioides]